ncbi:protoporphyrinogen oxidase [Saccharibacillus qingshengii]|uniref:protoporphyrinogen oxidase n=1 Tax=Saccharibacillus qingshengii TaxID=1763540 RepID=UPI001551F00E|nr:protoporphyrinogen oxidase [Saccharibacillus qingshengii]
MNKQTLPSPGKAVGSDRKVVILGGGISGLSAAYYLQKEAVQQGISLEITVVEADNRLGGRLQTQRKDGFLIEKGPDAFLARKPAIMELTDELGLTERLMPTNPDAKTSYILHKGRMHPMPMGFILGIPTKLSPFIRTGLISPLGKLRAALDFFKPARRIGEDEALGDFIERRLGREVLEQITEPLLAGIYAGDTRSLSVMATFPQFKAMEANSGSLIKGMARGGGRPKPQTAKKTSGVSPNDGSSAVRSARKSGGAGAAVGKSMFLSYRGGLSELIARLEEKLLDQGARFVQGSGAASLTRLPNGSYDIGLQSGETLNADGVICAVPAYEAARLLGEQIEASSRLRRIDYVSVANIALAYRTADLNISFERSGFLVPRKEGKRITACTWSSTKWTHVAPEGQTLLRTYIGRSGAQEWTSMSDAELIEEARRDLRELTGLDADPRWSQVNRCLSAMPQYPVGHVDSMRRITEELEDKRPGVLLCGAGYGGVGIPDCIAGGREAARILLRRLPGLGAANTGIDRAANEQDAVLPASS